MARRYNVETAKVADGGEEKQYLYIKEHQVFQIFRAMEDGDDIVIHRVEDDEPGVIYLDPPAAGPNDDDARLAVLRWNEV
jgi:hypothetical protein